MHPTTLLLGLDRRKRHHRTRSQFILNSGLTVHSFSRSTDWTMVDKVLLHQGLALLGFVCWWVVRVMVEIPFAVFRCLLSSFGYAPEASTGECLFYEGTVFHTRRRPKENSFKYPVRMAVVNMDNPPSWWSAQAHAHMHPQEARELAGTKGTVLLLTDPVSCGYIQNPISVYYCYSESDSLDTCVAEVTNTPWGERVTFLFDPKGQTVPKSLHVSPFMDMKNIWTLQSTNPRKDANLTVSVKVSHPELGEYFDAYLVAKKVERANAQRNECNGFRTLWRYGFQPHRVGFWIYWQAVKLLWKGVPFCSPPCKTFRKKVEEKASHAKTNNGKYFVWRDAQDYPWNAE